MESYAGYIIIVAFVVAAAGFFISGSVVGKHLGREQMCTTWCTVKNNAKPDHISVAPKNCRCIYFSNKPTRDK